MRDFREHCVYVTFVSVPTATSGDMTIQFVTSTSVGFNVRDGQLVVYYNDGNYTPIKSVPYDPVAHHILRLRETGGSLFWETSADGTTFAGVYSEPDRIDLSSIGIRIIAGTFAAQATRARQCSTTSTRRDCARREAGTTSDRRSTILDIVVNHPGQMRTRSASYDSAYW